MGFGNSGEKWPLCETSTLATPYYWSDGNRRDALFGAHLDSLSSLVTGFSVCHPIYDDHTLNLSLMHAIF